MKKIIFIISAILVVITLVSAAAFVEVAADVNLDGVINGKDLTLIRRFITGGFGVELGK